MSDSSIWQLITVALAALIALIVLLNVGSAIAAAVTFPVALAVFAFIFLTDPGAES
jgi:hypothetical protein